MEKKALHLVRNDPRVEMNRENFSSVYDLYVDKIYQFIYYKTYHRETAEDLTSMTFLKALDNLEKFDPAKGYTGAWLYKIARNLVIDFYRKKRQTVSIEDVWDLAGDDDLPLDTHNKWQLEELRRVMQALPMEQRDVLIMRIWQDLSYKEIAVAVGKTEAACKMVFSRTIAGIRKTMAATALILIYLIKLTG